ncbi:MAG: hypothetical protein ABW005_01905, partial [Burkholderiaceae bacterium]
LVAAVVEQLDRLRRGAAPTLAAAAARAEAAAVTSEEALDPALLAELIDLLRRQSLSAMDSFERLSPQLRRRLGKVAYAALQEQVGRLQFGEAAEALLAM